MEILDERRIRWHIRKALTTLEGENQLAEYAVRFEISEWGLMRNGVSTE